MNQPWSASTVPQETSDGGLYALDAGTGEMLRDLYLGDVAQAGMDFPANIMPADSWGCEWEPSVGRPIFASPAVAHSGSVLIGTDQGFLFCIGDSSWKYAEE